MYHVMFWNSFNEALLKEFISDFIFSVRESAFDFIREVLPEFKERGCTEITIRNDETGRFYCFAL